MRHHIFFKASIYIMCTYVYVHISDKMYNCCRITRLNILILVMTLFHDFCLHGSVMRANWITTAVTAEPTSYP